MIFGLQIDFQSYLKKKWGQWKWGKEIKIPSQFISVWFIATPNYWFEFNHFLIGFTSAIHKSKLCLKNLNNLTIGYENQTDFLLHCAAARPPPRKPKRIDNSKKTKRRIKKLNVCDIKRWFPHAGFLEELSLCNTLLYRICWWHTQETPLLSFCLKIIFLQKTPEFAWAKKSAVDLLVHDIIT